MRTNLLLPGCIGIMLLLASCKKNEMVTGAKNKMVTETKNTNSTKASLTDILVTQDPYSNIFGDAFGYNTEFSEVLEPWGSNNFLYTNAYEASYANNVRYPAGTVANYWDANNHKLFVRKFSSSPDRDNGWVDAAKINPDAPVHDIIVNDLQKENTLADLKNVVSRTNCSVVFVLNMVTPGRDFYASSQGWNRTINDHPGTSDTNDDWYKMLDNRFVRMKKMLKDAQNNNISIKYVQLGNELYWGGDAVYHTEAFPNGQSYAIACNYIVTKLRNDTELNLPSTVKFAFVGAGEDVSSTASRVINWNEQVFSAINENKFDDVTLHNYASVPEIATFNNLNVKTNVVNWINRLNDIFTQDHTYQYVLSPAKNWRVWYTELRANPHMPSVWGRCLLEVYAGLHSLGKNGVLYMQPNFHDVVNSSTGALKARAYAFIPLMRASKFATQAAKIYFPGIEQLPNNNRTVLQGYSFKTPGDVKKCAIISFSEQPYTINLSNIYGNVDVIISGQKNTDLNDGGVPVPISGHTNNATNVVIEPYSINFIRL